MPNIVELLNRVTLRLHQKGIKQWIYPWDMREIEIDIKSKKIYVYKINDLIVGTFSLRNLEDFYFVPIESNSKYLYRIAILPEYQGKGIGIELVKYCCNYARENKQVLYLDCWAGNKKLRSFYSSIGFELIGDFAEEDYMVSLFKFK